MNTASAEIPDIQQVVVEECVLHIEGPIQRIGQDLIGQPRGSLGASGRCGKGGGIESVRLRDSTVGQEVTERSIRRLRGQRDKGAELRRDGIQADVVEDHVSDAAETGANYGVAILSWSPGDTNARAEAKRIGAGRLERQETGDAGDGVEALSLDSDRHSSVFVAQAEVDGQVLTDSPGVLNVGVGGELVAVIGAAADVAQHRKVGQEILQVVGYGRVLVIPADALEEELRRDIVAEFAAEFECVRAANPGQILAERIQVVNGCLRIAGVRTELKVQVVENQVRERIQPGKGLISNRLTLVLTLIADTKFIDQIRIEGVILGESS